MGYLSGISSGRPTIAVTAVAIDTLSADLKDVEFFSIDVEGFEVSVLRGARRHLRTYRPVLVVEAHADALRRAGSDVSSLLSELTGSDYIAFEITRLGLRPMTGEHVRETSYVRNWLALPRERKSEAAKVSRAFCRWAFSPRTGLFRKKLTVPN